MTIEEMGKEYNKGYKDGMKHAFNECIYILYGIDRNIAEIVRDIIEVEEVKNE